MSWPVLRVDNLVKTFGKHNAVDGISFDLFEGEVLGIVGESGSGKSTTVRCIVGLEKPDGGSVLYDGRDLATASREHLRTFRSQVQMVFQDPYSSLDPRMTVRRILEEPLLVQGGVSKAERTRRVEEVLDLVGLSTEHLSRHPRAFSGGQRQRIAIARALVSRPKVLICDEPVSALDVSVQAQVLNLLKDMQRQLSLTVLFIAHDLAVVRYLCDRVVVMDQGRIAEQGLRDELYDNPQADYTKALLAAVPRAHPESERARRLTRTAVREEDIA